MRAFFSKYELTVRYKVRYFLNATRLTEIETCVDLVTKINVSWDVNSFCWFGFEKVFTWLNAIHFHAVRSCFVLDTYTVCFAAKTRDLLFSGSKKSFEVPKDANCNDIYPCMAGDEVAMEEEMSPCSRQLLLTNTGELTNPVTEQRPANAFQALMMAKQGICFI